jgi:hypothetical protein
MLESGHSKASSVGRETMLLLWDSGLQSRLDAQCVCHVGEEGGMHRERMLANDLPVPAKIRRKIVEGAEGSLFLARSQ